MQQKNERHIGWDDTGKRMTFGRTLANWSQSDFDGDIDDLVNKLQALQKDARALGYLRVKIEADTKYDYYDSTSVEFEVYAMRIEADQEFSDRMAELEAHKKKQRQYQYQAKKNKAVKERELYEELHRKYGDNTKLDVASE